MTNKLYLRLNTVKFKNYLSRLDKESKRAARQALLLALEELERDVLGQVPRDTNTLANSFSFKVIDSGYKIGAYAGFAWEYDAVHPRTGKRASEYMLRVHEDLSIQHKIGKAKFLEDPMRKFNKEFNKKATVSIVRKLQGVKV